MVKEAWGRLVPPALALCVLAAAAWGWTAVDPAAGTKLAMPVGRALTALAWLAGTWTVLRLLDACLWRGLLRRSDGNGVPGLVVGLVDAGIWAASVVLLAETVFAVSLATLVATSGIAIAILGFALRDTLASLFSGIALSLERPYQQGDWIEVAPGQEGRVVEIGWLTTRLLASGQMRIVVPNARLATASFKNYGPPGALARDQVTVQLDHGLPPRRVERILLAAVRSVAEVQAAGRAPDVRISDVGPEGVRWLVRFWLSDWARQLDVRTTVQAAVLRHLHQAGLGLPYPKLDLFHSPMPARVLSYEADLDRLLARSELFAMLPREELAGLAARAHKLRYAAGATVVREGEPGSSLFVVMEGVVQVLAGGETAPDRPVETLGPGAMFGEFALLTGAPRSATVRTQSDALLFEICREDLEPVLQRRPELAQSLGRALAERQEGLAAARRRPEPTAAPRVGEEQLLARIRHFFGL